MPIAWLSQTASQPLIRYVGAALVLIFTLALLFRINSTPHNVGLPPSYIASGIASPAVKHKSLQTIVNSTLGFERILAINLPERTDHHDGLVLASAVSGLSIAFVNGVHGENIVDKVLPAKHDKSMSAATKGSWRAHINAISQVVENGWQSALIIEDDVDWDVRLKTQLQDYALASRHMLSTRRQAGTVKFDNLKTASMTSDSPYGDSWDVLWLGHCGMELPPDQDATMVLHEHDNTAPQTRHQRSWDRNAKNPLESYPQHSRMVAEQHQGTCSLAYAVSQDGARKLLLQLGLRRLDMAFDLMLREWCQVDTGLGRPMCLGILPQIFDHHRRVGSSEIDSDISGPNGQYRDNAFTLNIRWSVRMNMEKILRKEIDYDDQWPDD